VEIAAADIGTGARTALTLIAAEALEVEPQAVLVRVGDSDLPEAPLAGGSMGTSSWGSAVAAACQALRIGLAERGDVSAPVEVEVDTTAQVEGAKALARHAFGAQFVEAWVDIDTGEIRVPRMVGVFAAGRIVNPITARSQLIGGMTMGLSMALFEESILDEELGTFMNRDLADYHIATFADVGEIDVSWVEEEDQELNGIGAKGIGEIGIVGTAAAVTNAVYHATGVRLRELPLRPDRVLNALTS
jgi:xanthine dehydrogenase YagR molybdenum-binding subunit